MAGVLADGCLAAGRLEEGLSAVDEGLAFNERSGFRFFEPDLLRIKGELLLQGHLATNDEGEACFHRALDVARDQQAKYLELRSATSLARFWQRQGKRSEARALLAPIYDWFTEGFDTPDLKDARRLLDELS